MKRGEVYHPICPQQELSEKIKIVIEVNPPATAFAYNYIATLNEFDNGSKTESLVVR